MVIMPITDFAPKSGSKTPHENDAQLLKETFIRHFDESKIRSIAQNLATNPKRPDAEGSHFRSFEHKCDQNFSFAINLAKISFEPQNLSTETDRWLESMTRLKGINGPHLIPPFRILEVADRRLVLVLPFGPNGKDVILDHWRPLDQWIETTTRMLAKNRLFIDDLIQIRSWKGIPFIIDFSDLKNL